MVLMFPKDFVGDMSVWEKMLLCVPSTLGSSGHGRVEKMNAKIN